MGDRVYDDMDALRRDVAHLIDAGRYRLTHHARTSHPELSELDKLAIIRFGGRDRLDAHAHPASPRYLCWAHHPRHGRCRGVYAIARDVRGDLVVIITAFPED